VINGLRQYAKSVITYALKNALEYELNGNYKKFTGEHLFYDKIEFIETNNVFTLKIGRFERKIVIIANEPQIDDELIKLLKKNNTCLFYYSERPEIETLQTIGINPLDPDSVERAGIFIKRFLISSYSENLKRKFKFPQLLRDYVKYIPQNQVRFDTSDYTYAFHSYPKIDLKEDDIKKLIEADSLFSKKSRPDKDNILKELSKLFSEINNRTEELKNKHLHCFNCGELFQSYSIDTLSYMKCQSCNSLFDNSTESRTTIRIDDLRYNSLSPKEFGMDFISFNPKEL
jgi:predicted Zn-ribbon and HTH transcriptional regulator